LAEKSSANEKETSESSFGNVTARSEMYLGVQEQVSYSPADEMPNETNGSNTLESPPVEALSVSLNGSNPSPITMPSMRDNERVSATGAPYETTTDGIQISMPVPPMNDCYF
jgi:hypothetical protein